MEHERGRNIAVGITSLAGLIGLLAMLFLFGYMPAFLEEGYTVDIHYPNAGGLNPGSAVRLDGIDVGAVESIKLKRPAGSGVVVTARLQPDIRLPEGIHATVHSHIFGGVSSVSLRIDDKANLHNGHLPTDGSAVIEGEVGSIESRFASELKAAIAEPAEQFRAVQDDFNRLTNSWVQVADNLATLTTPADPDAVDAGRAGPTLATVVARADARLIEMQATLDALNAWFGDEQLRKDAKTTMANTAEASAKLSRSIDTVEKRIVKLTDDLAVVTAAVNTAVAKANEGQGTVGKLLNDPQLYNNLNDSAQRLQKALDEARLLIEKWKAEGVPVQF